MYNTIPKNSPTASLRRIPFTLVDATDLTTPINLSSVAGVKSSLSFGGGAFANSANDIVKVDGASGEYYQELTQTESNTALGTVRGKIQPTGCMLTKFEATIGPLESFDSPTPVTVAAGGITAGSFATDALDANALAASAVTEIQAGLATATALAAVATAVGGIPNAAANGVAVRAALATELARIDVPTSSLADPVEVLAQATSALATALGGGVALTPGERTTLTASVLSAMIGHADWKLMRAYAGGHFTFTPPASYPGTGTLLLYAADGTTLLATVTLTYNDKKEVTNRAVA